MKASAAYVLGTPLQQTTYTDLTAELQDLSRQPQPFAVDFTNTHIVTMRRHDPRFRELTSRFDYFIPDATPLIWCLKLQGAKIGERVYGPTFMRECVLNTPVTLTHYFLGGSEECVQQLRMSFVSGNPSVKIIGARSGFFKENQQSEIVEEINRLSPDFVWVGLGTPRQQSWIHRHKHTIKRGIVLAVGFAFDVNAGMKKDSPVWMQKLGLGWLYRLCSEPLRLGPRYLKYNVLFLFYLLWDGLHGRAWKSAGQ